LRKGKFGTAAGREQNVQGEEQNSQYNMVRWTVRVQIHVTVEKLIIMPLTLEVDVGRCRGSRNMED